MNTLRYESFYERKVENRKVISQDVAAPANQGRRQTDGKSVNIK